MSRASRLASVPPLVGFALAAVVLLGGLGRHGIWDPGELTFADALRGGLAQRDHAPLYGALARIGFAQFGPSDWSGRVYGALACLGVAACAMGIARRLVDGRAAAYAAVLTAATPLVVLNARWMVGDGLAMLTQALTGLGVFLACFDRADDDAPEAPSRTSIALGVACVGLGTVLGTASRGLLLTALPPLLAGLAAVILDGVGSGPRRGARIVVAGLALVSVAVVARHVVLDSASYDLVLGGAAGGNPPTFEKYLQVAFHTLAPASPLFVLGAARAAAPDRPAAQSKAEVALVLWATFAWGATTLFASRYGTPTFLGVVPVIVLAAVVLRAYERDEPLDVTAAVVATMLFALVVRDYALYPGSPLAAVAVTPPTLAPDFRPGPRWGVAFSAVAVCFALAAVSHVAPRFAGRAALREAIAQAWRTARSTRGRRVALALVVAVAVLVELAALAAGFAGARAGLSSLAVRAGRAVAILLPVVPIALAGLGLVLSAFRALGGARMVPAVVAALGAGVYVQGPFLVELSGDLSPRDVYATYNERREAGDKLVEFDLESRAAEYYALGEVEKVESQPELLAHLRGGGTRWAMFRRNILPEFNRTFHAATGTHLYVADARNHDVVLVRHPPDPRHPDQNPIAGAIARNPRPQHPVDIHFSEVDLVGYDLELPQGDSVGAGQSFRITWYWRAHRPPSADWQVFLHVDGAGQRLNGDHAPIEGLMPMRQWPVGEVVKDTQRLDVPVSYPSADYTLYVGFFHGEPRMPILRGDHTPDNRAIAGIVRVR